MKLSEYKNEDALELLADLIEPVSVLMTDEQLKKMVTADAKKLDIARYLLKSHNKEIIAVLARLNGADVRSSSTRITISDNTKKPFIKPFSLYRIYP